MRMLLNRRKVNSEILRSILMKGLKTEEENAIGRDCDMGELGQIHPLLLGFSPLSFLPLKHPKPKPTSHFIFLILHFSTHTPPRSPSLSTLEYVTRSYLTQEIRPFNQWISFIYKLHIHVFTVIKNTSILF